MLSEPLQQPASGWAFPRSVTDHVGVSITRAIERGVDVKVIAERQGHKHGGTLILRTYSHVNPVHSRRMAALMTTEQSENIIAIKRLA